eukprot:NODE_9_length_64580_cov_1.431941.p12 type:complete len:432 gc:universal NODE_9_length_64580_cov_1.431941:25802-24507(-)
MQIAKVRLPVTKLKNSTSYVEKEMPTKTGPSFVIHDGPPYCSGNLHIGHALNKIIKDITLRYRLLRGNQVYMRPGFDTHGLPVELKARQKAKNPLEIRSEARQYALSCLKQQSLQFQSWNILGDWKNPYKTMDTSYVIKQMKIFNHLYKSGLIYRDYKPVYWSPANQTALAEAEIEYEDITSQSVFVRCQLDRGISLLVWTTTPYTIPANMAVSLNRSLEYVKCIFRDETIIVGKSFIKKLEHIKNSSLLGTEKIEVEELLTQTYLHPLLSTRHRIVHSDHVTDGQTCLVHIAPGHGMEDFIVAKKENIKVYCPVNESGEFDPNCGIPELIGLQALEAGTVKVIELLRNNRNLLAVEPYKHSYPVDWRKKQPIITRSALQYFCRVDKLKELSLECINATQFVPNFGKEKLSKSITSRAEWCISRQRYFNLI